MTDDIFGDKKKKKKGDRRDEPQYPKLTAVQLKEISELIVKYGGVNQVLKYWQAVRLDEAGNVIAICDYTDWYAKSDENQAKYEKYQPLSGIKYIGIGMYTMSPYSWCKEWISSWSVWIQHEAMRGDIQAQALMRKGGMTRPTEMV